MAHKRYKVKDDAYLQLQTGISASTNTINVYTPTEYGWIQALPQGNWIGTLVQYGSDGNPRKKEKVYVKSTSGNVLSVKRWYLDTAPQTFNSGDYLFLNVVAAHIDDIHLRIDEVEENLEEKREFLQEEIDDIYSQGNHRLRVYREKNDPPLQVRIWAGTYQVGQAIGQYAGGTLNIPNNSTKKLSLNQNGEVEVLDEFDGEKLRLATVTARNGKITAIELWKNDALGGKLGGSSGGFENISNCIYEKGLLKSFRWDGVNWTLTYDRQRRLKTAYDGANTYTIEYDAFGNILSTRKS